MNPNEIDDLKRIFEEVDNEMKETLLEYEEIVSTAQKTLEQHKTIYQIKQNKWLTVSHSTFQKWKGLRKVNGLPYIGPVIS